jgi:hypothetical protein
MDTVFENEIATFSPESITKKINYPSVEFCLVNMFYLPLYIFFELPGKSNEPLQFLCKVKGSAHVYFYPREIEKFSVGTTLFASLTPSPTDFIYKPYMMNKFDHYINFGEISTDFLHGDQIKSTRNEILRLYFENRSLRPYNIFYGGNFVCRVGPYYPTKFKVEYVVESTNFDKHFQLGTWLEVRMDLGNPKIEKSQFIYLHKKSTTDINLGDVVGRAQNICN